MVARTTQRRVMTPGNRRFVRTALAVLGLMALATATVWIVLFDVREAGARRHR
jgi:hypothetical protein